MSVDLFVKGQPIDYLIVGSGPSAMGVLFGLLYPYHNQGKLPFSVAVVERGSFVDLSKRCKPSRWFRDSHKRKSDVCTVITGHASGRELDVPVGSGVGGSSLINACLCMPPAKRDFETWPEPWKGSMNKAVETVQTHLLQNQCLEFSKPTKDSFLSWTFPPYPSQTDNIPLLASKKKNGAYVRRTFFDGLVHPLIDKNPQWIDSIKFIMNFTVHRLLLSHDNRVVGVEGIKDQTYVKLHAAQVILCAGTIETPILLHNSGLQLSSFQIRDHPLLVRAYLTWPQYNLSVNGVQATSVLQVESSSFQVTHMDARIYLDILPHALAGMLRFHFAKKEQGAARWMVHKVSFFVEMCLYILLACTPLYFIVRYLVAVQVLCLLNPQSMGEIKVVECSPTARQVDIDLGYLKSEADMRAYELAWEATTRIQYIRGLEVFPGRLVRNAKLLNSKWFRWFARRTVMPYFHFCGSCPMASIGGIGTVDSSLRFRGTQNLFICDASVFPNLVSAPTQLTCAALGYQFGSNIHPTLH